MKFRLFISTFALVFFAELGDKTQLTALAVSAAGDKWIVFAAASAALATSTLLAVLFGKLLTKFIPPKVIKILSSVLFLAFGVWVLWSAFNGASTEEATAPAEGFFGVFALVFFAELGDKTQLTAMARSAAGSKWIVFFGATAALTLSTFIAVIFGDLLQTYINPQVIKSVSGGLFLIFGGLILYQVLRPKAPVEPTAPVRVEGLLARAVLEMAAQFEEAAADDYRRLAAECEDPALKELLLWLEDEERSHLDRVRKGIPEAETGEALSSEEELPSMHALTHNVSERDKPVLLHAIEHELATAEFYAAAARAARLPGLREAFDSLAYEERQHALRLQEHL